MTKQYKLSDVAAQRSPRINHHHTVILYGRIYQLDELTTNRLSRPRGNTYIKLVSVIAVSVMDPLVAENVNNPQVGN